MFQKAKSREGERREETKQRKEEEKKIEPDIDQSSISQQKKEEKSIKAESPQQRPSTRTQSPTMTTPQRVSEMQPKMLLKLANAIGDEWMDLAMELDIKPASIRSQLPQNSDPVKFSLHLLDSLSENETTTVNELADALKEVGLGPLSHQNMAFQQKCEKKEEEKSSGTQD